MRCKDRQEAILFFTHLEGKAIYTSGGVRIVLEFIPHATIFEEARGTSGHLEVMAVPSAKSRHTLNLGSTTDRDYNGIIVPSWAAFFNIMVFGRSNGSLLAAMMEFFLLYYAFYYYLEDGG